MDQQNFECHHSLLLKLIRGHKIQNNKLNIEFVDLLDEKNGTFETKFRLFVLFEKRAKQFKQYFNIFEFHNEQGRFYFT